MRPERVGTGHRFVVEHRRGLGREVHPALVTPSSRPRPLSTRPTHDAQVIPRSGARPAAVSGALRSGLGVDVARGSSSCSRFPCSVVYPPTLYSTTAEHSRARLLDAQGRLPAPARPDRGPGPRPGPDDRRGAVLHRRPDPDRVGDPRAAGRRARPARRAPRALRPRGDRRDPGEGDAKITEAVTAVERLLRA